MVLYYRAGIQPGPSVACDPLSSAPFLSLSLVIKGIQRTSEVIFRHVTPGVPASADFFFFFFYQYHRSPAETQLPRLLLIFSPALPAGKDRKSCMLGRIFFSSSCTNRGAEHFPFIKTSGFLEWELSSDCTPEFTMSTIPYARACWYVILLSSYTGNVFTTKLLRHWSMNSVKFLTDDQ